MILWGFLGQVNSKPLLELISGNLQEEQNEIFGENIFYFIMENFEKLCSLEKYHKEISLVASTFWVKMHR